MKVGVACDHNGIELKSKIIKYLKSCKYEAVDFGPFKYDALDDYPDYAFSVGEAIRDGKINFGILICGTGIGMSIACNKVRGVRCAHVSTIKETRLTRIDNDSNVIAISKDINFDRLKRIIDTFLTTDFSLEERHNRRVNKIKKYEC